MGFTVLDEIKFDELGDALRCCYISISGNFSCKKNVILDHPPPPPDYKIVCNYKVFPYKNAQNHVVERTLIITQASVPSNFYPVIYEAIKADPLFAGKNTIDD